MPSVHANGIDIEYESIGDPGGRPMLLIMGLGMQMIAFDDDFCAMLADRGFRVVRFDNRDAGLSSAIEDGPVPDVFAALGGDTSSASYTLDDMADDAAGLLDALDIAAAHVVGVSMGGMIAQVLAIRHPSRVLSLTSIMSTSGDPAVGQPSPEAMSAILVPPVSLDRDVVIEHTVATFRVIGSPGDLFDEGRVRDVAARSWDRNHDPLGMVRQLLAIAASGDRTPGLHGVTAPTLVIHGEEDPLVAPSGGAATAAAVPGARLMMIPAMGHDLPAPLWPSIVDAIAGHAAGAGR